MDELATVERQEVSVPAAAEPTANALMSIITRAASDPSVDVNKLQALLAMHKEIAAKVAEDTFNAAMRDVQEDIKPVVKRATNPQTSSKYAKYEHLDEEVRPIYTKHGFGLSFDTGEARRDDEIKVVCYVTHVGGHTRTYHIDMPADGKGAKGNDVMTRTHATGAGASYGRRYLLTMIFNIPTVDTDGNAPRKAPDGTVEEPSLLHDWMIQFSDAGSLEEVQDVWKRLLKVQNKVPSASMVELRKVFAQKQRQFGRPQ